MVPPVVEDACSHVYYFFVMRYLQAITGLERPHFVKALQAEGFPVRLGYLQPLYLLPMYQRRLALGRSGFPFALHPQPEALNYRRGACPVVERLQDHEVVLTHLIYPPLTEEAIAQRCARS
jgi:hypothetical protein